MKKKAPDVAGESAGFHPPFNRPAPVPGFGLKNALAECNYDSRSN